MGGGRLRKVVAYGDSTVSYTDKPILLSSLGLRNGNVTQ